MATIALKLAEKSAPATIVLARRVHDFMSTNAGQFTAPVVPLAELLTAADTLDGCQQLMDGGSRADTVNRNAALKEVREMLKTQAAYVQAVSGGDEAIIQLAGMSVKSRGPRKYEDLVIPDGLILKLTAAPGQVKLSWNRISNTGSYEVQWSPSPASEDSWKAGKTVRASRATLDGLPSLSQVWVRVRSCRAAGVSPWSAAIAAKVM
jgi:hypothetical protein